MLSPGIAGRGRCPRTPSPRYPPRPDQPLDRVRFGDHVHLGAQRLHHPVGGQVAARVGDAHDPVALLAAIMTSTTPRLPKEDSISLEPD